MSESLAGARDAQPETLKALPSVDRVLNYAPVREQIQSHGRGPVLACVRALLDEARAALLSGSVPAPDLSEPSISASLAKRLDRSLRPALRPVFNLTGTVLHTNLGRAVLPAEAIEAVAIAMRSPCNLEYDLAAGGRGDRDDLIEPLLRELTGCEAATVVNNNAAAVLLALNTLSDRKEAIVSRGEQIEIGGAFRMPDIMRRAGCRLREVGTTNRTHLSDYAEAIGDRTGVILKVHTSNYEVQGFTAAVDEAALGALARERNVPLVVDLGAGALVDLSRWGLPREPMPQEALAHGAAVVTFSGDKLLGGPQAGILVGDRSTIAKIRKNPLKRALRVGKLTLAALEAVLRLYRDPDRLGEKLAALKLLARPLGEIAAQADRLRPELERVLLASARVTTETCASQIGSGALPVERLTSVCVAIRPTDSRGEGRFLASLERAFRMLPVPVIGRVTDGAFRMDLRCLEPQHEREFIAQLKLLRKPGARA